MIFSFGKKKEDQANLVTEDKKKRSLHEIESDLTILGKSEMNRVEGGKETKKPLSDFSDLRDSLGGTIPL
ncbi:MAG: hypothetical protein R3A50_16290 [Saprospiraceae bacterium]|nr:hypothetical protein [Saprospiraceae bacterium]MCB9342776.1 hypothetical protein [Lewinellaceae bacterium]